MKYYKTLLQLGCFTREDIVKLVGSDAGASSLIYDYLQKGYIKRVRRNLYVTISLETDYPVLNRYQIGSCLFEDAYISHHSALEMFNLYNQVFNECYVATNHRFEDFDFYGIRFHRVPINGQLDVIEKNKTKYSSLEKTVIDSINDCKKIAGLEEIIRCLVDIKKIDEEKLLKYLNEYNNGFLYQKCGYIFESLNDNLHLSKNFFRECKKHISNSKRYLDSKRICKTFNSKWNLYVPTTIYKFIDKGIDYNAIG